MIRTDRMSFAFVNRAMIGRAALESWDLAYYPGAVSHSRFCAQIKTLGMLLSHCSLERITRYLPRPRCTSMGRSVMDATYSYCSYRVTPNIVIDKVGFGPAQKDFVTGSPLSPSLRFHAGRFWGVFFLPIAHLVIHHVSGNHQTSRS